jgi:hypothetical protein
VTGGVQPAQFQFNLLGIVTYVRSVLWRTTPILWLGFLLCLVAVLAQKRGVRLVLLFIFLIGFLFILLFGIANGRNSAHYVLTTYVSLDILAAAGFMYSATWLASRLPESLGRAVPPLALGLAILLQAGGAFPFFPYYYTYYNPIMEAVQPGRQNPSFGYGEGLELAASYLAQQSTAGESTAVAFYGRGPFSYFYPGKTEQLKPVYADAENVPQLRQVIHKSQYVVLYYELEHERNSPANVMQALESLQPEKSIWLNGIEYVRIYRVDSLPPQFYAALAQ